MAGEKSHRIDFQPLGRRGECEPGDSILECGRRTGVGIINLCGGKGKCHACKVKVLKGEVSEPTPAETTSFSSEEIGEGWRLACQVYPSRDCSIGVPPESMTAPQRTQVEGVDMAVEPDPPVLLYKVELAGPDLSDLRADANRLINGIHEQHGVNCRTLDGEVLRTLSTDLRSLDWECGVAVRGDEVIGVGSWPGPHLGLAVDLGTTKIAGYLMDLSTGKRLVSKGIMNPQISFGEDVITRIDGALSSATRYGEVQKAAVEALNLLARDLCGEAGFDPAQILEAVVGCNTAMHHLFLGLPVKQLVTAPYVPATSMALDWKARDLGLELSRGAYVHMLPNVAGFVGGDHVAMLLATQAYKMKGLVLALDIGTNTEVSLINEGRISSVSCASGPAFEGYQIKHGMRAARGAIERVRIDGDSVAYQTIDDAPPVGICGSGVLDAMSQMYLAGIIDRGGRIGEGHPRVRDARGEREFILAREEDREGGRAIGITQKDIRQLQLAKAAIRTGIQVLLEVNSRSADDIDKIIIAGAFGTYIDVESAVGVGMLPRRPMERYHQVGNAAGIGAQLALISSSMRREAEALASRIRYVELAGSRQFSDVFVRACYLGDYQDSNE
jgi:uncharacterized 2Fe-2S/4Fe-4S cluster protein (DUF4445 family)